MLFLSGLGSNFSDVFFGIVALVMALFVAIPFHEFAHAKMADRLGDPTPEGQGRLTLNPMAHMDPVGTICLLFAGFGWGKPVKVGDSIVTCVIPCGECNACKNTPARTNLCEKCGESIEGINNVHNL